MLKLKMDFWRLMKLLHKISGTTKSRMLNPTSRTARSHSPESVTIKHTWKKVWGLMRWVKKNSTAKKKKSRKMYLNQLMLLRYQNPSLKLRLKINKQKNRIWNWRKRHWRRQWRLTSRNATINTAASSISLIKSNGGKLCGSNKTLSALKERSWTTRWNFYLVISRS